MIDLGTRDGSSPLANLTTAKGMLPRLAQGMQSYRHLEAFCLMLYRCSRCGHQEVIWNSRDGVTPFCAPCPSCGRLDLCHAMLGLDWCVPDHRPHFGQRVWIDMTHDRAAAIADVRLAVAYGHEPPAEIKAAVTDSIFHAGHAPDLAICGYGWSLPI